MLRPYVSLFVPLRLKKFPGCAKSPNLSFSAVRSMLRAAFAAFAFFVVKSSSSFQAAANSPSMAPVYLPKAAALSHLAR
jgi:hypothetical protein